MTILAVFGILRAATNNFNFIDDPHPKKFCYD